MIVRFSTRAGALTMHGDAPSPAARHGPFRDGAGAILAADLPGALREPAQLPRELARAARSPASRPKRATTRTRTVSRR